LLQLRPYRRTVVPTLKEHDPAARIHPERTQEHPARDFNNFQGTPENKRLPQL
jgi:hypothetical protein